MSGKHANRARKRFIHPGERYATQECMVLSTLLGSCVSVCLFDPVARVMGMNHFLLPARTPIGSDPLLESDAGRYGLLAMNLLIDDLLGLGAQRARMCAKAFGGANVLGGESRSVPARYDIGTINSRFVRQFLAASPIPLVAADLGGCTGRQIHFYGGDYSVFLRRIPRSDSAHILASERYYVVRALEGKQRPAALPRG